MYIFVFRKFGSRGVTLCPEQGCCARLKFGSQATCLVSVVTFESWMHSSWLKSGMNELHFGYLDLGSH